MSSSEAPSQRPPRQVSHFEANLLRILSAFFGQTPAEEAARLVREVLNRPRALSASAMHLVRDTLAKGCVLYLVRAGGWKIERFLRGGEPKRGRLWERSPVADLSLRFSKHTLEFLIWLTANRPADARPVWQASEVELTIADRLILFLSYATLRDEPDIATALRSSPSFAGNILCRLFYPGDFAEFDDASLSFADWFAGTGALVLESLQSTLEARWLEIERGKGQLGDWELLRRQGEAESRALDRFLDAAEHAKRPDLARFLLGVLARVLATPDLTPAFWTGGLLGSGPPRLAERAATQLSALALLRQSERFGKWEQQARASGYLDDDYAAAKFWLGEWERIDGRRWARRAADIVQTLMPLRAPEVEPGSDRLKPGNSPD